MGAVCDCLLRDDNDDEHLTPRSKREVMTKKPSIRCRSPLQSPRRDSRLCRSIDLSRLESPRSPRARSVRALSYHWAGQSSTSTPQIIASSNTHGISPTPILILPRLLSNVSPCVPEKNQVQPDKPDRLGIVDDLMLRFGRSASIYEDKLFSTFLEVVSKDHPLEHIIDLESCTLVGCGHYGFIFRSEMIKDGREVAVKMLGTRWKDVAVTEWAQAAKVSSHDNILDYFDVLIFPDTHRRIEHLLRCAQKSQELGPQQNRTSFPTKYFVLLEEFMNRGTIEDWVEQGHLLPGGMLKTTRLVASALAHMHECGVAHNDVKPANILLSQDAKSGDLVSVKLADLGLAFDSDDFGKDSDMFGKTVFCMATGELFTSRMFKPELIEELVKVVSAATDGIKGSPGNPLLLEACAKLPSILRQVWNGAPMAEVRDEPALQGWRFFDGDFDVEGNFIPGDPEHAEGPGRRPSAEQLTKLSHTSSEQYLMRASDSLNSLRTESCIQKQHMALS